MNGGGAARRLLLWTYTVLLSAACLMYVLSVMRTRLRVSRKEMAVTWEDPGDPQSPQSPPDMNAAASSLAPMLAPDCREEPANAFERMVAVRQLQSDLMLQERLADCDDYFRRIPVAANNDTWPIRPPIRLAFSHQVHKEVAILEIFFSVIFR